MRLSSAQAHGSSSKRRCRGAGTHRKGGAPGGQGPVEVRLMAVTKGFPGRRRRRNRAGITLLGENRVQEAELKYAEITGRHRAASHRAPAAQQGADGLRAFLLHAVHRQGGDRRGAGVAAAERGRTMDILLELNTSGEPSKSGFRSRDELLVGPGCPGSRLAPPESCAG